MNKTEKEIEEIRRKAFMEGYNLGFKGGYDLGVKNKDLPKTTPRPHDFFWQDGERRLSHTCPGERVYS